MRSSVSDFAAGAAVLAFAGMFQVQSGDLEGVSLLFPRMLIIFLTLGGLLLCAQGLLKRRRGTDTTGNAEPVAAGRVTGISVASIGYVLLIPVLGFYSASTLFLFTMAVALSNADGSTCRKALAAAVFTVVLCASVWAGFALLLSVPAPEGLLF